MVDAVRIMLGFETAGTVGNIVLSTLATAVEQEIINIKL